MRDLIFIVIGLLLTIACTDKDLNVEFSSRDSIEIDNWDEVKDFTKLEGKVKVLESGKLEFPDILVRNLKKSLKYKLFQDKKTELKLLSEGLFVMENDFGKHIQREGIYYMKLFAEKPFVMKIQLSATRMEDFSIEVFTKP